MTHTYSCFYYHLVWSTKNRKPWIPTEIQQSLYHYIAGIISNKEGQLLEIGGMSDHIHLLVCLIARVSIPELVRDIKGSSTKWLKQEAKVDATFAWQEGYGIFSVSYSNIENVRSYIRNQEEHHKQQTFEDEYKTILDKVMIKYDPRFVLG